VVTNSRRYGTIAGDAEKEENKHDRESEKLIDCEFEINRIVGLLKADGHARETGGDQ